MNINYRKLILTSMAILCMYIAYKRCYNFYVEDIPIGEEMSCFDIVYPQNPEHYEMRIITNNWSEKESLVMVDNIPSRNESWSANYTFAVQRTLNPKKIECQ